MSETPDYWSSDDGIATRIDQIAHLLSWGSLNTAIKEMWGYEATDQKITWRTYGDADVCDICWDGEGTTYTVDDPLLPDLPDDTHPFCLPGDALVSPRGRITGVTKRKYNGDLVILRTASGRELSLTPNHPVLSPHGWIPAGFLNKGDYVVGEFGGEKVILGNGNHENVPTPIQEVANSFLMMPTTLRLEVPVSSEDFHGDGGNSEVAIIGTNRHLPLNRQSPFLKHFRKSNLVPRNIARSKFMDFSDVNKGSATPVGSLDGKVRGSDLVGALRGGHLRPFQQLGLMLVTNWNTCLNQSPTHGAAVDVEVQSDLFFGNPARIEFDQLVSVDRKTVNQDDIYNLETSVGYFNAEGIIVHNCRCFFDIEPFKVIP